MRDFPSRVPGDDVFMIKGSTFNQLLTLFNIKLTNGSVDYQEGGVEINMPDLRKPSPVEITSVLELSGDLEGMHKGSVYSHGTEASSSDTGVLIKVLDYELDAESNFQFVTPEVGEVYMASPIMESFTESELNSMGITLPAGVSVGATQQIPWPVYYASVSVGADIPSGTDENDILVWDATEEKWVEGKVDTATIQDLEPQISIDNTDPDNPLVQIRMRTLSLGITDRVLSLQKGAYGAWNTVIACPEE